MGMTLPNNDSPREQARFLMARKDSIELELETQLSILKSNNSDTSSRLVDREGFPLADVDIWAVRTARVRIIELRNDLKAVMDAIGKALEQVYDPSLSTSSESGTKETVQEHSESPSQNLKPFAKVDGVAPGSPAADAVCTLFWNYYSPLG